MRILLMGSLDFAEPLRRLGHEVVTCGPGPGVDIALSEPDPDWSMVERLALAKGPAVDAVLVSDDVGFRRVPVGVYKSQAITACYCVDSPLNAFWQQPYAALFDVAMFDQPAEADLLARTHARAHWLPLGVDPQRYAGGRSPNPKRGACFVGVVDAGVRPKRSAVLARVKAVTNLTAKGGRRDQWFGTAEAAKLYASHQVVINENLFPGLTTRPLEVMASEGLLLSEAAPGVMDRHFQDFEHLLYYDHESLDQRLRLALGDPELCRRVARNGREAVLAGHTLDHRAADLARRIEAAAVDDQRLARRPTPGEALRLEGEALLMCALRWPAKDGRRRLLRATARLREAAADGASPLPAARAAGLAEMAINQDSAARAHLQRAAELGGTTDRLALAIQAGLHGDGALQARTMADHAARLPDLLRRPGEPEFHLAAAALLAESGQTLTPGFAKGRLPMVAWTAFEHILEAIKRRPAMAQAWLLGGNILLDRGAACEASVFFGNANELTPSEQTARLFAQARKQGYLT